MDHGECSARYCHFAAHCCAYLGDPGDQFYSNARSALESKARSGVSYFNTYVMVSYNEYYRNAVLYAKDFEDADTIELQFLDKTGASTFPAGARPLA